MAGLGVIIIFGLLLWILTRFGWWTNIVLVIILLVSIRETILTLLFQFWYLFIRSYNTSYPVFSRFEIGSAEIKRMSSDFNSKKAYSNFHNLDKKSEDTQSKRNEFRYYVEKETESKMMRDEVTFMIKGNIAASNGEKQFDEVCKEFGEKFGTGQSLQKKYKQEANKRYEDWEKSI